MLDFFSVEFDFQEPWQTVAIIGVHTVGTLVRENSGFNEPNHWLAIHNRFTNQYYKSLIGGSAADFQNIFFKN